MHVNIMCGHCCSFTLEGDVRLVGGSGPHEGRVEVYHNGVWGTVCDDGWDLQDAMVVCRQLGYINATAIPPSTKFGSGSGPSMFSNLDCSGSESSVTECGHLGVGQHNCTQNGEAKVVCNCEHALAQMECVFMCACACMTIQHNASWFPFIEIFV